MFCKNCGIQIDIDSKFCYSCGTEQKINITEIKGNDSKAGFQIHIEKADSVKPQNIKSSDYNSSYDETHRTNTGATVFGVILLIISVIISISASKRNIDEGSLAIIQIISLCLRIFIVIWCVNVAKELNRSKAAWGLFAFFLPSIALIFIGLKKRLSYSPEYISKSDMGKAEEINNLAYRYAKAQHFQYALFLVNKSIELEPEVHAAFDTRGYIKYFLKDYHGALADLNKSIEMNPNYAIKYYHRGSIYKQLGKMEEAFLDWNQAVEMGSKDAEMAIINSSQND